jgi:ATP-dependent DNA ligase
MRSARAASKPSFVEPMAAQLVGKLPEGPERLYELKFDGYRALILKDGDNVSIISRNRKDLTRTGALPGTRPLPRLVARGLRRTDRKTWDLTRRLRR